MRTSDVFAIVLSVASLTISVISLMIVGVK